MDIMLLLELLRVAWKLYLLLRIVVQTTVLHRVLFVLWIVDCWKKNQEMKMEMKMKMNSL